MSGQTIEVASLVVRMRGEGTAETKRGLDAASASVDHFAGRARNAESESKGFFGGLLGSASKLGLVAAGVGAVAGGMHQLASTIKIAGDFDQKIAAIRATAGATDKELAGLRQTALDLGAATDVGSVSASDAANAIFELGKAGVSVKDIMGGAAKATLQLAAAGGPEYGVAKSAALAATALNTFKKEGLSTVQVANILVGAANASAIGLDDLQYSLSAAGTVAAGIGMSFKDLNTNIAVFGMAGLKGSDAGTSLKAMLVGLQPHTKAQTAAFREFGLITKDNNNILFDSSGKLKDASVVAGILKDKLGGLSDAQKQQTLYTMFGTDAMRAANIMVSQGKEGYDTMAAAMLKQGDAAKVASDMSNNLKGKWEALIGTIDTWKIQIGSAMIPTLNTLIDRLNAFLGGGLSKWPDIMDKVHLATTKVKDDWDLMVSGIRPFADALSNIQHIVENQFGPAIQKVFAGDFGGARAQFAAGWSGIQNNLADTFSSVQSFEVKAKRSISNLVSHATTEGPKIGVALSNAFKFTVEVGGDLAAAIQAKVQADFATAQAKIETDVLPLFAKGVMGGLPSAFGGISKDNSAAGDASILGSILAIFPPTRFLGMGAQVVAGFAPDFVQEFVSGIVNAFKNPAGIEGKIKEMWTALSNALFGGGTAGNVKQLSARFGGEDASQFKDMSGGLIKQVGDAIGVVAKWASTDGVKLLSDAMGGLASGLWNWVTDPQTWKGFTDAVDSFGTQVSTYWAEHMPKLDLKIEMPSLGGATGGAIRDPKAEWGGDGSLEKSLADKMIDSQALSAAIKGKIEGVNASFDPDKLQIKAENDWKIAEKITDRMNKDLPNLPAQVGVALKPHVDDMWTSIWATLSGVQEAKTDNVTQTMVDQTMLAIQKAGPLIEKQNDAIYNTIWNAIAGAWNAGKEQQTKLDITKVMIANIAFDKLGEVGHAIIVNIFGGMAQDAGLGDTRSNAIDNFFENLRVGFINGANTLAYNVAESIRKAMRESLEKLPFLSPDMLNSLVPKDPLPVPIMLKPNLKGVVGSSTGGWGDDIKKEMEKAPPIGVLLPVKPALTTGGFNFGTALRGVMQPTMPGANDTRFTSLGTPAGTAVVAGIGPGMTGAVQGKGGPVSAVLSVAAAIKAQAATSFASANFTAYGNNVTTGFAAGIDAYIGKAQAAAQRVARAVATAMQVQLDSHSPSRVTRAIGDDAGMGFVGGVIATIPKAVQAATDLINSVTGTMSGLKGIGDFQRGTGWKAAATSFLSTLDEFLVEINRHMGLWQKQASEQRAKVAGFVGDEVTGLTGAVDPLMKLGSKDWAAPSRGAINSLFSALDIFVVELGKRAGGWAKTATEAAAATAKFVGDAVGGILAAVDPIQKLASTDLRPLSAKAADTFFAALDLLTERLNTRISLWWGRYNEASALVAESVGKAVSGILSAFDSVQKLASTDMKPLVQSAVDTYFAALDMLTASLNNRISLWWGRFNDTTATIADSVGKAVSGVLSAFDSVQKLAGTPLKPLAQAAVDVYMAALDLLTDALNGRVSEWWGRYNATSAGVADSVGKAVSGILSALDPIQKLVSTPLKPLVQSAVDTYFGALDLLTGAMQDRISLWWGRFDPITVTIAESVGKAVSGLLGAVSGLTALTTFKAAPREIVAAFFSVLDQVLDLFGQGAALFQSRVGPTGASIAESIGKLVTGIGQAIAPLVSLAGFKRPSVEAINDFYASLGLFLHEFDRRAADFAQQAGTVASDLAVRMGIIGESLGKVFAPLLKVAEVQKVDRGAIEGAMANLHFLLYQLEIVRTGLPAGFSEIAGKFMADIEAVANGITAVFSSLKGATDAAKGTDAGAVSGVFSAMGTAISGLLTGGWASLKGELDRTAEGTLANLWVEAWDRDKPNSFAKLHNTSLHDIGEALVKLLPIQDSAWKVFSGHVVSYVDSMTEAMIRYGAAVAGMPLPGAAPDGSGSAAAGTPTAPAPPTHGDGNQRTTGIYHNYTPAVSGHVGTQTVIHNPVYVNGMEVQNGDLHRQLTTTRAYKARRQGGVRVGAKAAA